MEIDYIKIKRADGYMYGGNQSLFGKKSRRSGCGMIAACDVILYSQGKRSLGFSEYAEFVSRFRDEVAYKNTSNLIGIFPRRLAKMINSHLPKNHDSEYIFISRRKFSREGLRKFISDSISMELPVIVRIGANGKRLPYKIEFPDQGNRSAGGKTDWHYITVTGMTDSGKLIFSSWGGKGELECDMLYKYFGFTGGVIADKKIGINNQGETP